MCPQIEIDDQVFEHLKRHAEPFVDQPNDVLRRLLLDSAPRPLTVNRSPGDRDRASAQERPSRRHETKDGPAKKAATRSPKKARTRAPSHALLPERDYEIPILRALDEAGGRAPTSEVVAAVGKLVADKLKPMDREMLDNQKERWENRVQFTRLRLVERGLLKKNSPRGLWEISSSGKEALKSEAVAA